MSAYAEPRRTPLLLWPFRLLWMLVTFVVSAIGILLGLIVGCILMMIGVLLTGSLIGAVIGIPMFVIGLLLVMRAIF